MLDRSISFLVAISLASLVWLYMRSRDQETLDNVSVPVKVQIASGQKDSYELEVTGPNEVGISFTGPLSRIREVRNMLQRGELRVTRSLSVPPERQEESHYLDTVVIEAGDLHLPWGVTCQVQEGRNRVQVTVHHLVEQRLPVRFETAGNISVGQWRAEPESVVVRGPQEILEKLTALPTTAFLLPARAELLTRPEVVNLAHVPLVQEIKGRALRVSPREVSVRMTVQPQQREYELTDVPVQFLCPPNFPLRPIFNDERAGKISLRLLGPYGEAKPAVTAYIDLGNRKWEQGLYEEPVKLQLSKDVQLAGPAPRSAAFQLVPADAAPKPGTESRSP